MSLLEEATQTMLKIEDPILHNVAEHRFIEALTFSSSQEIVLMLNENFASDWSALPAWARNLAFRLACLLEPTNTDLLRRAAFDLSNFGPDWDSEAELLYKKADDIERLNSKSD